MEVPGGLTADVFQRALDALLPTGLPKRRAVLAGPGQPSPDAGIDILLVPVHPQTCQTWAPADPMMSAYLVPLPLGVWLWLAPHDKIFGEKISTRVRVRPKFEEALRTAREVKARAPHCRVIFTVY